MRAVEFIKKRGWNMAKIHLDVMDAENWHNSFYYDLKRLVESWELVEFCGGLEIAKKLDNDLLGENFDDIQSAIADVESVELS